MVYFLFAISYKGEGKVVPSSTKYHDTKMQSLPNLTPHHEHILGEQQV